MVKNNKKKGFTLVELIVVIAIMAVLAGTVAGVTVSQLNRQTNKSGIIQAQNVCEALKTEIANTTSPLLVQDAFVAEAVATFIGQQFGGASISITVVQQVGGNNGAIYVVVSPTHIVATYCAKGNGGNTSYNIDTDGNISEGVPG